MLDLSMTAKQAHWNIHGRGLLALHTHLDEIAARARDLDDDLAERAAAGGQRGTRAHRRVGVVEVRGGDLVPQPQAQHRSAPSCLRRNISYAAGPCASGSRWVAKSAVPSGSSSVSSGRLSPTQRWTLAGDLGDLDGQVVSERHA
ncbi:hypothetical protein [Streptodolium elevatio]